MDHQDAATHFVVERSVEGVANANRSLSLHRENSEVSGGAPVETSDRLRKPRFEEDVQQRANHESDDDDNGDAATRDQGDSLIGGAEV